eukprot:scaffold12431_cov57-Attheya_sp.AAC.14
MLKHFTIITVLFISCLSWSREVICAFSSPRNPLSKGSSATLMKYQNTHRVGADTDPDGEMRELLNKRKVVEMNPSTSHLASTLPVVMETELYPEAGTIIFEKGDKSNGLYFVKKGVFECVDDVGTVVRELEEGDLFGEIVRSATSGASLWFVAKEGYNLISQLHGVVDVADMTSKLQGNYEDYMDFRSKRIAVQSFNAFRKKLTKDEIDRVAQRLIRLSFEKGQTVAKQGTKMATTDMFFIDSGTFEVYYDDDTGKLLFLDRPRAKSIRASSPVDEDIFEDEFLSLLANQYRDAGLLDKTAQVLDYLEAKSRPKQKPVSLHSTVAIVASGSYLTAYQPFFHPGFDKDGFVRFFDFSQPFSIETCHQIQFSVGLMAVAGIMGYFRIPPSAPDARRLTFTFATLTNVFFALTILSSLNALPEGYWLFDAFSDGGTAAFGLSYLIELYFMIAAFDNATSGSDAGMDSIPGGMGRASNICFASLIYFVVNTGQVTLVAPIFFSDRASYQGTMSTAFEAVDWRPSRICSTFAVFNCDASVAFYKAVFLPDLLPINENSNNYLPNLMTHNHLVELGLGITGLVVLNAIRKSTMMDEAALKKSKDFR